MIPIWLLHDANFIFSLAAFLIRMSKKCSNLVLNIRAIKTQILEQIE